MKRFFTLFLASIAAAVVIGGLLVGSTNAEPSVQTSMSVKYAVKFHEFDGCECNAACPCVFSSDTTFGDCRAIAAYTFEGIYGTTELKDVSCALVLTSVGKNMEATTGKWKGVLYMSAGHRRSCYWLDQDSTSQRKQSAEPTRPARSRQAWRSSKWTS
jgi:hypothetical protein